jgi:hypothetical protein
MHKNTFYIKNSLQSEYSLKIVSYWRIFASKYSLRSKYSQNIKRISYSREHLLVGIQIQANIRLQIFTYVPANIRYVLHCFNFFLGKPVTSLN